jgi:hypothetical protein
MGFGHYLQNKWDHNYVRDHTLQKLIDHKAREHDRGHYLPKLTLQNQFT